MMSKQPESKKGRALEASSEETSSPLAELLSQKAQSSLNIQVESYPHNIVGEISKLDKTGYPIVIFSDGNKQYAIVAKTTVTIGQEQVGQECLISFNQGKLDEPIVTGLIQQPQETDEDKPIVIHSESGIILKCGSSRIELTEDGTINIQGMHINSQAYGPHRIKGGSVKIN